jgi:hypothetical protein
MKATKTPESKDQTPLIPATLSRSPDDPTCRLVVATKALVDHLLSINTHNRPLRNSEVEYLRKEIQAGNFTVLTDGVGVTKNGVLCNGQNRLWAMSYEGYPQVKFWLMEGLDNDCIMLIDQGRANRTIADSVALMFDEKVNNRIVAACNVLLRVDVGWTNSSLSRFDPTTVSGKFKEVSKEIGIIYSIINHAELSAPVLAALVRYLSLYPQHQAAIIDFATKVITGEMLSKGDPAYTLRKYLDGNANLKASYAIQEERFAKTTAALIGHIKGKTMTKVMGVNLHSAAARAARAA